MSFLACPNRRRPPVAWEPAGVTGRIALALLLASCLGVPCAAQGRRQRQQDGRDEREEEHTGRPFGGIGSNRPFGSIGSGRPFGSTGDRPVIPIGKDRPFGLDSSDRPFSSFGSDRPFGGSEQLDSIFRDRPERDDEAGDGEDFLSLRGRFVFHPDLFLRDRRELPRIGLEPLPLAVQPLPAPEPWLAPIHDFRAPSVMLAPGDVTHSLLNEAWRAMQNGRYALALSIAEPLRAQVPGADPSWLAGWAAFALGRYRTAAAALRDSLEIDPLHLEADRDLARCFGSSEEAARLGRQLVLSLAEDPSRPEAWFVECVLLLKSADALGASQSLQALRQLAPSDPFLPLLEREIVRRLGGRAPLR